MMTAKSLLTILCIASIAHGFVPSHHASFSTRLEVATTDYLESVRDGVQEAGFGDAWTQAASKLSESTELNMEEAEDCLARAWNWKNWAICSSPIARKYIKPQDPNVESIVTALEWVTEHLELNPGTLKEGILQSPEAYLKAPEQSYTQALKVAPKKWSTPDDFKALLAEDPTVLQRTYNCEDEGCNSECGNCWVQYSYTNK